MASPKSKIPDEGHNAQEQILELQQELQRIRIQGSQQFDTYQTSLTTRYCSAVMSYLFSQRSRCSTWRRLWLHLAEAERALGIETITLEAVDEMRAHLHVTDSDFEVVRIEEKRRRHVRPVPIPRLCFLISLPTKYVTGCYGCELLLASSRPVANARVACPRFRHRCPICRGHHPLWSHELLRHRQH